MPQKWLRDNQIVVKKRLDFWISGKKLRARLKLNSLREYLQDRRLQCFGHLQSMEENAWSSKSRTFKVSGSFPRGRPSKTWNEISRNDLEKSKITKNMRHKKML